MESIFLVVLLNPSNPVIPDQGFGNSLLGRVSASLSKVMWILQAEEASQVVASLFYRYRAKTTGFAQLVRLLGNDYLSPINPYQASPELIFDEKYLL